MVRSSRRARTTLEASRKARRTAALSLSTAILVEASLSFLGLGTQPPTPSLGLMLADSRDFMLLSPWASVFSGLAILVASLGFNLFGDGLRDIVDPALRGVAD